jgi:AraC-like DNA-binding protein
MRAELLPIPAAPGSWRYAVRTAPELEFSWGFHTQAELVLITAGTGRRLVGDSIEPYAAGDLVLLADGVPHTWVSASGSSHNQAVIAQFAPGWVWAIPELAPVHDLLRAARRGLAFDDPPTDALTALTALGGLEPARRTLALLGLLLTLAGTGRPLASAGFSPDLGATTRDRVDTICRFLQEAYPRPVTLAEIAATVHLSPAACSRLFSRAMGRTLTDYLDELRVDAARRLLIETDLPVGEVAARAGFANLSWFNRRFRHRTSLQPGRFRAQFRP